MSGYAAGVEIFNADGSLRTSLVGRTTNYVGAFTAVSPWVPEVFIPVPGYRQDGTWFFCTNRVLISYEPVNDGIWARIDPSMIGIYATGYEPIGDTLDEILFGGGYTVHVFRC